MIGMPKSVLKKPLVPAFEEFCAPLIGCQSTTSGKVMARRSFWSSGGWRFGGGGMEVPAILAGSGD